MAEYDATSPDELALVSAAQTFGAEFFCRTSLDKLQLRLLTSSARFIILGSRLASVWDEWAASASAFLTADFLNCRREDGRLVVEEVPKRPYSNLEESKRDDKEQKKLIWVPLVEIEILDVLEFDNDRKRMSVIIR